MARKKEDLLYLSEWMASDTDFFVIRRFEVLNTRVILKLQTEICALESRLSYLDRISRHNGAGSAPRSFLEDGEERTELLDELEKKLDHYSKKCNPTSDRAWSIDRHADQYILAYSQIQARSKANPQQIDNIRQWIRIYSAISPFETNFAMEKDQDLIAINEDKTTPFRDIIAKLAEAYTNAEV
jgi:hypothetical protein